MTALPGTSPAPAWLRDLARTVAREMDREMSLRVTIEDRETGEREEVLIPDGEYFLLTTSPCYLAHTNAYPGKGTHVLTIKGRNPKPLSDTAVPPPVDVAEPRGEDTWLP